MWKSSLTDPSKIPPIQVFQGNALCVNPRRGEGSRGFDRIYIGASVERSNLSKLTCLLKPGGVLVGPGTFLQMPCFHILVIKNLTPCYHSGRRTGQGHSHPQN